MKKFYLAALVILMLSLAPVTAWGATADDIPADMFRAVMQDMYKGAAAGTDLATVTFLNVSGKAIDDLAGIDLFTNLQHH